MSQNLAACNNRIYELVVSLKCNLHDVMISHMKGICNVTHKYFRVGCTKSNVPTNNIKFSEN